MYYPLFFNISLGWKFTIVQIQWGRNNRGVQVQPPSTDRIPPFIFQLLLLLYYVTYLYYIIYFSNIKVFF